MRDLPVKLRRDSLSAPSEQARFLQAEAGNRVQSDSRYGLTLALTGRSDDDTDSRKATYDVAGRNTKSLTTPEISIPPRHHFTNGMSKGFWRLK